MADRRRCWMMDRGRVFWRVRRVSRWRAVAFRPQTTLRYCQGVPKYHLRYACRRRVLHQARGAHPAPLRGAAGVLRGRLSAVEVGERFGYSPQVVHQMASELRAGKAQFFHSSKPGPKGPRKSGRIRDRVLALRAQDRSVTEIAQALIAEGTPVSAQTVWSILNAEGLERLQRKRRPSGAPRRRGSYRSRRARSRTGRPGSACPATTPGCSCSCPGLSSLACPN